MLLKRDIAWVWLQAQLNVPYIWGGDDFSGWDCSGLVQEFLAVFGMDPPGDQTANTLREIFMHFPQKYPRVMIPSFGDIIFYGDDKKTTHVAIALNKHHCIEAGGGGRSCRTPKDSASNNAYVRIRPILRRKDIKDIYRVLELFS